MINIFIRHYFYSPFFLVFFVGLSLPFLFEALSSIVNKQPLIGGVLTLGITGALGFLLYKLPLNIFNMLKNLLVLNYRLDSCSSYQAVKLIEKYLYGYDGFKISRSFSVYTDNTMNGFKESNSLGVGNHIFVIDKCILFVTKVIMESAGGGVVVHLKIGYLGLSKDKFLNLLDKISKRSKQNYVYSLDTYGSALIETRPIPLKSFDQMVLKPSIKKEIIETIDFFLNNEQLYRERGIPYKLNILLHGPSGTGKSSIVKAIANYCNFNIATYDIGSSNKMEYRTFINLLPKFTIVSMDDVDSLDTITSRDTETPNTGTSEIKLSTFLNGLDGVAELDAIITIISTNKIENIDKALFRPERIDAKFNIAFFDTIDVGNYIKMWFKLDEVPKGLNPDLSVRPAYMQKICRVLKDPQRVIENANRYDPDNEDELI